MILPILMIAAFIMLMVFMPRASVSKKGDFTDISSAAKSEDTFLSNPPRHLASSSDEQSTPVVKYNDFNDMLNPLNPIGYLNPVSPNFMGTHDDDMLNPVSPNFMGTHDDDMLNPASPNYMGTKVDDMFNHLNLDDCTNFGCSDFLSGSDFIGAHSISDMIDNSMSSIEPFSDSSSCCGSSFGSGFNDF